MGKEKPHRGVVFVGDTGLNYQFVPVGTNKKDHP